LRILAHGVDVVDLAEFERLLVAPKGEYAKRCFTRNEIDKVGVGHRRTERLAARFAAKEAVLKALGTGWVTGISWKDIEVHSAPNGAPSIKVYGEVERLAREKGIARFLVSLSHSNTVAMASVIGIGDEGTTSSE
jgi:holo-[acyl-carrier protein] synthase